MLKAFFIDGFLYAIPTILSRSLPLLLLPLFTAVLSPSDFGSLELLAGFTSIINLTVALEISQGVARFCNSEIDPKRRTLYASSAFWFTVFCYGVFGMVAISRADQFAESVLGQKNLETSYRLGVLSIWLNGIFYFVQNQLRWESRSKQFALVTVLMALTTIGSCFIFAYLLGWGINGVIVANSVGFLSGIIVGLSLLTKSIQFAFDAAVLKEMLAFSIPLVLSSIALWVTAYTDRLLISHFLTVDDVGIYGIGLRLASIAGLAIIGFQVQLTPYIYAHYAKPNTPEFLARIFRYFTMAALLTFTGLTLFSTELVRFLATSQYYGAANLIFYLAPSVLFANMYVFAPGIGIAKKTSYLIWINLSAAILSVSLNCFFIPWFGIEGAGLTACTTQFLVFCSHMVISQRIYPVPHDWARLATGLLLTIAITWFVGQVVVDHYTRWISSAFAMVVVATSFWFLGLVKPYEFRKALTVLRSITRSSY